MQKAWWQTFLIVLLPSLLISLLRNFVPYISQSGTLLSLLDLVILTFLIPYLYAVLLLQLKNLEVIATLPPPPLNHLFAKTVFLIFYILLLKLIFLQQSQLIIRLSIA